MRLYSRLEKRPAWERHLDTFCIYAATLLPLLFWHVEGERDFNWFIDNDFVDLSFPEAAPYIAAFNGLVFGVFLLKEGYVFYQTRTFNAPRNLVILGTFLAWYIGIVYYNGDLIFTSFNVISHGIPYLALVWIYGHKRQAKTLERKSAWQERWSLGLVGIGFFVGLVVALAYIEEGLWDALVWRDHPKVFTFFQMLPQVEDKLLLSVLVPLLALPQMTHYILDGFIWRSSGSPLKT
ncbi:hypothetical protein [Rufibacter soli]